MTGVRAALDTSMAVRLLNLDRTVLARYDQEQEIALPVTVIGELLFGALNSSAAAANLARHNAFIEGAIQVGADRDTALRYADLRLALRRHGRPMPENDLWIAATRLQRDLVLATSDRRFAYCPGLTTEDWTVEP